MLSDCDTFAKALKTPFRFSGDWEAQFTQSCVLSIWYFFVGGILYAALAMFQHTKHGLQYIVTWCCAFYCWTFLGWYMVVQRCGCERSRAHSCICLLFGFLYIWWGSKVVLKGFEYSIAEQLFFWVAGAIWIYMGFAACMMFKSRIAVQAREVDIANKDPVYLLITN